LERLANFANDDTGPWGTELERDVQIQQIVAKMDDWTREVWASRQFGYSWREIAQQFGTNEQQTKMRFRYAIAKIRHNIKGPSADERRSDSGGEM